MSPKIIATTDGSAHSKRIVGHAAALAKALNGELVLLSIVDANASRDEMASELAATLRHANLEATPLVEALRQDEDVPDAILRIAAEQDASMLAMDSRGHGAIRQALVGSVAMDLLSRTSLPVMLSGENTETPSTTGPYRIVVTSDGSHDSTHIFRALAPLLPTSGVALTLLRVYEPRQGDDEAREMAAAEAQLTQLKTVLPSQVPAEIFVRKIIPGGGVDIAIIEKAREIDANAIALSTHGVSAARHLLMGSTASLLLGRSPVPIILARAGG